MFTIISYDIINDKQRTKVMKLLKGYGTRVQYSVFECLLDEREFSKLGGQIRTLIDENVDSVRCYRLDAAAVGRIAIVGIGRVTTEPTHYVV